MRVAFHYVTYSLYLVGCTSKGQQQSESAAQSRGKRSLVAMLSPQERDGGGSSSIFTCCWSCLHIIRSTQDCLIEVHLCRPLATVGESLSNLCTSGRVLVNSGRRNCHSKCACFSFYLKGSERKSTAGFESDWNQIAAAWSVSAVSCVAIIFSKVNASLPQSVSAW